MKKRFISLMLVLCFTAMGLTACGSKKDSEDSAKETSSSKVIKVGAIGTHVPYNYMENEKLVGYEVDIWKEIAKRNNLEIEFVNATFDGLFGMLDAGKIDTIMSQISVTDERKESYDFTTPYMYNPGTWLIHKDAEDIKNIDDLFGKKVGVIPSSVDVEMYKKADPEGKIEQVTYQEHPAAIKDVENKRIDAVGIAAPQGAHMLKTTDLNLKISGNNGITETNAFPFLKGKNEELRKMASKTIDEMREEGVLKELSIKWFGIDTTVEEQL